MTNYFFHMKQKFHLRQNNIKVKYINLLIICIVLNTILYNITIENSIKQIKLSVEQHFLTNNDRPVARNKFQEEFDRIIYNNDLIINNKNVEYIAFSDENIVKAQYNLTMLGTYLQFIGYLNSLNERNMLHKINTLNLKVQSKNSIKIKIDLESLYEIS